MSILDNGFSILLSLLVTFVVMKFLAYHRDLKLVSHLPGMRIPFYPIGIGAILPHSWWNPALYFQWSWRNRTYKEYGRETFSVVSFFSGGKPGFYTSNLDVIRQIAGGGHKTSFIKPASASQSLLLWGMNLIAADGELWRKHRRVMGPAFNNKLYRLVWEQTLTTYHEMIAAEGWANHEVNEVLAVQRITFKTALLIIGKCAFGFSFNWFDPPRTKEGKITLQEALRIVAEDYMISTFAPQWVQDLPFKRLKEIKEAREQVMGFMKTQIQERRADLQSADQREYNDLFSTLIRANEDETSKFKLDDEELIGNVYIMLFAGHETTAHTLAATLGLLSVHPEIQDEVFKQISSIVPKDRDPDLDDYQKLTKVLSVFYESLRMFPSGYIMIREATEDTTLQLPNPDGQEGYTTIPVPKGVQVIGDMVGVQYNPRYFENPEEFKPSRWNNIPAESEAFSAFSVGPRACLGRKFAMLESIGFLTMVLRDYRVEPLLGPGETAPQWKERVLQARITITLGLKEVPLKFVRRS